MPRVQTDHIINDYNYSILFPSNYLIIITETGYTLSIKSISEENTTVNFSTNNIIIHNHILFISTVSFKISSNSIFFFSSYISITPFKFHKSTLTKKNIQKTPSTNQKLYYTTIHSTFQKD